MGLRQQNVPSSVTMDGMRRNKGDKPLMKLYFSSPYKKTIAPYVIKTKYTVVKSAIHVP